MAAQVLAPSTRNLDPPPSYTRRDSDAASVHSSAPSYVSEAPTYYSTQPPSSRSNTPRLQPRRTGLPPATYAPGFGRLRSGTGPLSAQQYNVNEWLAVKESHQAPQYHNVAKRRATLATMDEEVAEAMKHCSLWDFERIDQTGQYNNSSSSQTRANSMQTPFSPQEDPELVGEVAARTARERRLYLENIRSDKEALKQESRQWDFMLGQMADWAVREKSWEKFKQDYERRRSGLLRRRK